MDVAKTWRGGPYTAKFTNRAGNEARLVMQEGMSADNFRDVEGEPEMVLCTVYQRCNTWDGVKVPRLGFVGPLQAEAAPADQAPQQRRRVAAWLGW